MPVQPPSISPNRRSASYTSVIRGPDQTIPLARRLVTRWAAGAALASTCGREAFSPLSNTWPFLSVPPTMITGLRIFSVMSGQEEIQMSRKQHRRRKRPGVRLHGGKAGTRRMGDNFAVWAVRLLTHGLASEADSTDKA